MPEDKKHQQKGKSDAKEQRKPRHGRQKSTPGKTSGHSPDEKKNEEAKVSVPQKPVYEEPGPEFYKGLKRETDEILKITEEANSKYKKKEIQSNWSKYEMPVDSYEEIEEQENMGADYEQLVQMAVSVGGHFQFKHEKSWDINTGPSLYDKYFEINMNNLANALCTIPFYERNHIEKELFSDTDILTMDNRAIKYKQKYYNDKSYTTPELKARDTMQNNLREAFRNEPDDADSKNINSFEENNDIIEDVNSGISVTDNDEIDLQLQNEKGDDVIHSSGSDFRKTEQIVSQSQKVEAITGEIDDPLLERDMSPPVHEKVSTSYKEDENNAAKLANTKSTEKETGDTEKVIKVEESKNAVISSPEDLEKWLDDFLDS